VKDPIPFEPPREETKPSIPPELAGFLQNRPLAFFRHLLWFLPALVLFATFRALEIPALGLLGFWLLIPALFLNIMFTFGTGWYCSLLGRGRLPAVDGATRFVCLQVFIIPFLWSGLATASYFLGWDIL